MTRSRYNRIKKKRKTRNNQLHKNPKEGSEKSPKAIIRSKMQQTQAHGTRKGPEVVNQEGYGDKREEAGRIRKTFQNGTRNKRVNRF